MSLDVEKQLAEKPKKKKKKEVENSQFEMRNQWLIQLMLTNSTTILIWDPHGVVANVLNIGGKNFELQSH